MKGGMTYTEAHDATALATFQFAMRSYRMRWERIDDVRVASGYTHWDEKARRKILSRIEFFRAGPGLQVTLEETLTKKELEAVKEADAELEATYQMLLKKGILLNADGSRPARMVLSGKGEVDTRARKKKKKPKTE